MMFQRMFGLFCLLCLTMGFLADTAGAADVFNAKDKTWWERNTGISQDVSQLQVVSYDNTRLTNGIYNINSIGIWDGEKQEFVGQYSDGQVIADQKITRLDPGKVLDFRINELEDITFRNCWLEGSIYVYSNDEETGGKTRGSVILDRCTFAEGVIPGTSVGGMSMNITNSYIASDGDAINVDGGLTKPSRIAYSWLRGPGYLIDEKHMDGIQIWREGYTEIYRNRIGGFDNACIIIHSGNGLTVNTKPRFGRTEPPSHITIKENFFERTPSTPHYFYLYVAELEPDITSPEYSTRPRYITITDNWFEKGKDPIFSGKENDAGTMRDRAMFVRTEEERDEGVRRQKAYPAVMKFREDLGYAKTATDARTWIVWNNNRWVEDGSEVDPTVDWPYDDMRGLYDLSEEREAYPLAPDPVPGPDNSSGGGGCGTGAGLGCLIALALAAAHAREKR